MSVASQSRARTGHLVYFALTARRSMRSRRKSAFAPPRALCESDIP